MDGVVDIRVRVQTTEDSAVDISVQNGDGGLTVRKTCHERYALTLPDVADDVLVYQLDAPDYERQLTDRKEVQAGIAVSTQKCAYDLLVVSHSLEDVAG